LPHMVRVLPACRYVDKGAVVKKKMDKAERIARELVKVDKNPHFVNQWIIKIVGWEVEGLNSKSRETTVEDADFIIGDLATALRKAGLK